MPGLHLSQPTTITKGVHLFTVCLSWAEDKNGTDPATPAPLFKHIFSRSSHLRMPAVLCIPRPLSRLSCHVYQNTSQSSCWDPPQYWYHASSDCLSSQCNIDHLDSSWLLWTSQCLTELHEKILLLPSMHLAPGHLWDYSADEWGFQLGKIPLRVRHMIEVSLPSCHKVFLIGCL